MCTNYKVQMQTLREQGFETAVIIGQLIDYWFASAQL